MQTPVQCRGAAGAWPAGLREAAAQPTRTASPCVYRGMRVPKAARARAAGVQSRDAPGRGSVRKRRSSAAVPRERGPQGCAKRPRPPKAVCRACTGAGVSRRRLERAPQACRRETHRDEGLSVRGRASGRGRVWGSVGGDVLCRSAVTCAVCVDFGQVCLNTHSPNACAATRNARARDRQADDETCSRDRDYIYLQQQRNCVKVNDATVSGTVFVSFTNMSRLHRPPAVLAPQQQARWQAPDCM